MSRAVRRQQAAAPKERPSRPPRAKAPQEQRRRFRLRAPRLLDDTFAELKKVTWPTGAETRYLATVVIIVSLAVGTALGLIDIFFNWVVDKLLLH
jgi:preprotein translocase SecE subunit